MATDGELWLTDINGTKSFDLVNASGNNTSQRPKFAPVRSGGYQWIVFMSRRDYGNQLTGKLRPQLWIAAIDESPSSGDPSHFAFYLRGQDGAQQNMQATFALPPCKQAGEGCSAGTDCCDGQCVKDQSSKYVCGMQGCSTNGNRCNSDQDCCANTGLHCVDGYCALPAPL
jgi:hypothetical protein